MLFSICPKDFLVFQHIDMTLENRGIATFDQSRLHIVSSLMVPSYISSNASLVATIVVVIIQLTCRAERNSKRVSMLEHPARMTRQASGINHCAR
jgi:ABC-type xylose transport system permease subunit